MFDSVKNWFQEIRFAIDAQLLVTGISTAVMNPSANRRHFHLTSTYRTLFYYHGLILFPTWLSNYINIHVHVKRISNFIPYPLGAYD